MLVINKSNFLVFVTFNQLMFFFNEFNSFYVINSEDSSKSLSDTIKVGAFVANKQVAVSEEDSRPDIPFSSLLTPRQTSSPTPATTEVSNTAQNNTTATTTASGGAIDTSNGNERPANDNTTPKCNSQNGSRRSSCSMTSANDDFIMVDLVIICLSLTQMFI